MRPRTASTLTCTGPPSGEYLIALSTRFTSTWRTLSGSAATGGRPSGARSESSIAGGRCAPAAATTARRPRARRTRSIGDVDRVGVEPARPQDVVDDPGEALGLARDHAQHALALLVGERHIGAAQCHRRAVDRRQRRPQLVRDRRDEVALQPLERALVRQVAERVDRALREVGRGERQPQLARADLDRQRLAALAELLERPGPRAPPTPADPASRTRPAR